MEKSSKTFLKISKLFAALILIIALVIGYVVQRVNRGRVITPEIARSMSYDQVREGDDIVDGTNNSVRFDAFFLRDLDGDGYAEKLRGTCKEIGAQDTLYIEMNVLTEGYLKDAKIQIDGKNFYLQTVLPEDNELKENYIGNDIKNIEFKTLNNGTQKTLMGIVRSGDYTYSSQKNAAIGNNINNYSRSDNKIILTGTYFRDNESEGTEIRQEVDLSTDWYGKTKATINATSQTKNDIQDRIDEQNQTMKLDFTVNTTEVNKQLKIYSNYVEGTIPELNGYAPLEARQTSGNGQFTYDSETRKFTITKTAETDAEGTITSAVGDSNTYGIQVIYPLEAYQSIGEDTVTIKIPVETYYEGYNNNNLEFLNPYKSNIAEATIVANYKNPEGTVAIVDVQVGKYASTPNSRYLVSKDKPLKIYNQTSEEEKDDNYTVRWYATTGTDGNSTGLILKETKNGEAQVADKFIKANSTEESMENVTTNVGIYFTSADSLLKEDGWIKVYDEETDELLAEFTKQDWNKYTSSNPYKYETSVKHIRVETSETNASSSIYVYNIKTLDDNYITDNYTREQFDNLSYIKSTLTGYIGGNYINTDTHQAKYEAPLSIATIRVSNNTISTQVTEEDEKIIITANKYESSNQVGWHNGTFLVKIPDEILTTEINSVTINNNKVEITSYEVIEEDGNKFIKINTRNVDNNTQGFEITINADITPDPRSVTVNRSFELYASNEETADYYYKAQDIYDVNNNQNTQEQVNKTQTGISLIAPNSLLTNQTITDYDEKGSMVVSPQVAEVKPIYNNIDNKTNEATIGLQLKNNYSSDISEVLLLGKIPFEGNTYVISGGNLNSQFTTQMKDTGIIVPEELQGRVDVYYSENENPNKDLSDSSNGWKTADQVNDWSKIKTFNIDFKDTLVEPQKEYVFYYKIKIPNGVEFNKASYSAHGIYFALNTDEGKYRTQTEPNKIGVRIADKFNIELTKFLKTKDKKIQGATYSIKAEGEETGKTATTDASGNLTINNLYVEKIYEIKEIQSPEEYELNDDIIKFIVHTNLETGEFTIEKLEGTTKGDITLSKVEDDYIANVQVEDEVRGKIKITKTEQGTETRLERVSYKITGEGLPETGKTLTTNTNGEVSFRGLKIGEEYTLEEVKAKGYYLGSLIKFRIINNQGTFSAEITEGTVKASSITEEDNIPTINLSIEDEKIPTYNLEITKIKKTTNVKSNTQEQSEQNTEDITYLAGAKFRLYKDGEKLGDYISDANGKIQINNLYQYVEGKDFNAAYTLKEVLPPEGYSKVKDITFKVEEVEGSLQFKEELQNGQAEKKYRSEGNTVKVTVEDNPSFKLIKKDGETNQVLSNCKFAIYNVDNGEQPAKNSKGETLGEKQTINGREYYVVTTDSNGEITADLTEGFYKAVEVEAPEQYDITGQTYYFGIGASREPETIMAPEWATSIGGSNSDQIETVLPTPDGGYIVGGYFSKTIQVGDVQLRSNGLYDGLIIKYASNGEAEWAKSFGGNNYDYVRSVSLTSDGGYIVGGYYSYRIQIEDIQLRSNGGNDGIIIKYASNGELEWVKSIGGMGDESIYSVLPTPDGGYIAGGNFYGTTQIGDISLTSEGDHDGIIIKYTSNDEVEWIKTFGGSGSDYIKTVSLMPDGGLIVGGYFQDTVQIGNTTLTSKGGCDGIVIKYAPNGEVEWARSYGGSNYDEINTTSPMSDGECIVGGYFEGTVQVGDIQVSSKGVVDGIIIKYSSNGGVEWAKSIGGSNNDNLYSVSSTSDGGYIVGGFFQGTVQVGDIQLIKNGSAGGIIKYSSDDEVEWARNIRGAYIKSATQTLDGGCIAGGYFSEKTQVGETQITSAGSSDGIIIKCREKEAPNIKTNYIKNYGGINGDYFYSVAPTPDGGNVTGGFFHGTVQVGNTQFTSKGNQDAIMIKHGLNGEVEWATSYGAYGDDNINSVLSTPDGGYLAGGEFTGTIQVGDIQLRSKGNKDGIIIKYDSYGEVEWARQFGGSDEDEVEAVISTPDGGFLVGGEFQGTIQVGDSQFTSYGGDDGIIIKYDSDANVEWAKVFGGNKFDHIFSVSSMPDGGYIVGGYFQDTVQVGDIQLTSNGDREGITIKYSHNGEVEWAKSFGGSEEDNVETVMPTQDGGCIAGGYFSGTIEVGNIQLTSNGGIDGIIIKYDSNGEAEWAKSIGGSNSDVFVTYSLTPDGGLIAGGYFYGTIEFGDIQITTKGFQDGIIIKYDSYGEVEWAKSFGGKNNEYVAIYSVQQTQNGEYIAGGYFSNTIKEGDIELISNGGSDGFITKITPIYGAQEQSELEVINKRKEYKITTDVKEIDGIKGGAISGEDKNPYETVKVLEDSTKEIKMTPEEDYEIIGITVNGEEYTYTAEADGTFTMPQFENITEDKHIVVTYSLRDRKIIINKVDKNTGEKLEGAKLKLDQIEERTEPVNVIGNIIDNGKEYAAADESNEITGVLGTLTNNGTYYFVNQDGKYVPTNSKIWQVENVQGATTGVSNSTANSYLELDLTGKTGKYVVSVNAEVSSESSDYGYATITSSTTAPTYSSSTGRFMFISGTISAKNYVSQALDGGQKYYIHLGYRKDGSVDKNQDQVIINSIKVYGANFIVYNFTNNNGKYESTNQGVDSTTCNSYIPIDLRGYTGKYNVTVNAEVSSQSGYDYGYATITTNTTAPSYSSSTGRFINISGTQTAKDYTTELDGGSIYYLHLGYYKNENTSTGDDKFTVNNVQVTLSDSELYHVEVTTNSEGQAITQLPFGKYKVTEVEAPDGYAINDSIPDIEFRADEEHEFTIEDEKYAKVNVHHYEAIKNNDGTITYTETKLADDELMEDVVGAKYSTVPNMNIKKYTLLKDDLGQYVMPSNKAGTYTQEDQEVNYYYESIQIPLTVHHYIDGTTVPVPLKNGDPAQDVTELGNEGEQYTTSPITNENLADNYELVEVPENSTGTYQNDEVIVTYYYKKAIRNLVINKFQEDGVTPLAGVKFEINGRTYTTDENGKIQLELEVGTYQITETETLEEYVLPEDPTTVVTITKDDTAKQINLTNAKEKGKVIVHHYIVGTTEPVPLKDGTLAQDEIKEGNVGDTYITKPNENVSNVYELVSEPENSSGTYSKTDTEVTYYYRLKDFPYVVNYLDKDTGEAIHTQKQGGERTYGTVITAADEIIPIDKYNFDSTDKETLTIDSDVTNNVINIYYTKKPGKVIVHYYEAIDNGDGTYTYTTNKLVTDVTLDGKVDDPYTTTHAEELLVQYDELAEPDNKDGNMTEEVIEVNYYYTKIDAIVTVNYINKKTNELLEPSTTTHGMVGDEFTSVSKDFDGFVLVEKPTEETVNMTREEIILNYYYEPIFGGVIEKHIDDKTGEILYNETHEGYRGKEYSIPSKTFEGYDLVESKLPENAEGIMTDEPIEVKYYYIHKAEVITKYVDKITGEELLEIDEQTQEEKPSQEIQHGHEGDTYSTINKTFEDYDLVAVPENAEGTMTRDTITVIYYYAHTSAGVIENHYDDKTGEKIAEEKTYTGHEGDQYETSPKDIEGYDLVQEKYPENATGTMTIEETRVNYYYIKKTDVIVKYVDKKTGEEIAEQEIIHGYEGETYETTKKDITGYELFEVPENAEGTMTRDTIEVIYQYVKTAKVIVKYIDVETNEEIAERKEIDGKEGDTYETKEEKIKKYMLVEDKYPENAKGTMEGTIDVIYYYRKPKFNLKIDKQVTNITLNGIKQPVNGDIGKVEVHRKELNTSQVEVEYKITVTNTGEITGSAIIAENIPSEMTMDYINNPTWTINEDYAMLKVDGIEPGKTKEFKVVLTWIPDNKNFGTINNTAQLVNIMNDYSADEIITEDNKDSADIIVSIATGAKTYVYIAGAILVVLLSSGIVVKRKIRRL